MQKLFVYGLLQVPRIQQGLFKRNVEQTSHRIYGFSISNDLVNGAYKTITPDCDSSVEGKLLTLTDEEIAMCDKFESVDSGLYKRITLEPYNGENVQAYIEGDIEIVQD